MKKLVYISHLRYPSEKTHSAFAMKTCEGFAKNGFDVELWVPLRYNPDFKNTDPFEYHGVKKNFRIKKIFCFNLLDLFPGALSFWVMVISFNFSITSYAMLRNLLKSAVFYCHDLRDLFILPLLQVKIFLEIHDFYKTPSVRFNKFIFSRIAGFIITNKYKIGLLNKEYGIPLNKMLYQPNAVDIEKFDIKISKEEAKQKLDLPSDKKIILYTGHLFAWKGVDTLLDAAKLLPQDHLVYFVGGTDKDIREFRIKKEKLGMSNAFIVGRKPHDEIPTWLKAADVLVLPNTAKDQASKYETSPVKLFEYMASGAPIVASDLPSVRDIVDENMVWFFEADSSKNLSQVIQGAISNSEESKNKAMNAQKESQKYTWDLRAKRINDFLNK